VKSLRYKWPIAALFTGAQPWRHDCVLSDWLRRRACGKTAAESEAGRAAVPEDTQSAADSLLGKETTVLLFRRPGKKWQAAILAANVVPKSSKNNLPGTIVTRAVVAANEDGKWMEILRCDEHLKNQKGFLPGTPIGGVTGWRWLSSKIPKKLPCTSHR